MATKKNNELISKLLSTSVVNSVASSTGATKKDVTSVLTSALPSLLSGASSQSSNSSTAASFLSALTSHSQKEESSLLSSLDLSGGSQIIAHLLGKDTDDKVEETSKETGVSSDTVSQIISAAAPILMSYLGKQVLSSISTNTASESKSKKTTESKTKKSDSKSKKTTDSKTKKSDSSKKTSSKTKKKASSDDTLSSIASSVLENVDVASILTNLLK